MLPNPKNYSIYPSVMLADQPTEMVIAPNEKAFLLVENEEYTVTVIDINDDEPDYYYPSTRQTFTVIAHDGVLRFTHTFAHEQEHAVWLHKGETKLQDFTVFSVYEDLYALTPLRGDLHAHSYRSDGKRDPAAFAGHFREQGYDFVALTDHNRFYPGGEIDETYAGVKMGLTRVKGEEVHAPGSVVHIVHVGGNSSVAEIYCNHGEQFEKEVAEYMSKVPSDLPEKYHSRYAKALWATDKIHAAGGIAIFAHPYWRTRSSVYNVCDEFAVRLLTSGMFDAYELIGGMGQGGNNCSVALWGDLRAKGLQISVVGSSDVHGFLKAGSFPHFFTVCFAKENTNDAIREAVKAGKTVAVEAVGNEYDRQYRAYGSHRLVMYAQFLLTHYFPAYQRVCQGEGVSMRAYAMNDAPAALIELQAEQAKKFQGRFFGKMAPKLPDGAMLAFEEKWRAVQLAGPITKGSQIGGDKITRQI